MSESSAPEAKTVRRRLTAAFQGHVQGVGFRFTTVEIARAYPITGYVQNMMDESVRVVAEGTEEELLAFLDALRKSHVFRYVREESIAWSPPGGEFDAFTIRYA